MASGEQSAEDGGTGGAVTEREAQGGKSIGHLGLTSRRPGVLLSVALLEQQQHR